MKQTRLQFIKTASAASAGALLSPNLFASGSIAKTNIFYPICFFSKCLQFIDYNKLGGVIADIGFKGVELSVRKDGHVSPENVKSDLPKAINALQQAEISVPMIVTDIVNPDDPLTEIVIGTAAENGVGYYRMGYLKYDNTKSIVENHDVHKKILEQLEKINRKFGIQGCYQNHQGTGFGGPVWDIYWAISDCDPTYMGVQYDIRHAFIEGARSWPLGMKLIAPWIKTTAIKDFCWNLKNGKWGILNVPLGQGMIDFDAYLKDYISLGISGPVTIHFEYELGGAESGSRNITMSLDKIKNFMKNDLAMLKMKFNDHGLLSSYN
ncbi:MAG: sugar phosphate isomerase/epimerase [Bacteroidales bacterium]|jgi:sugar phosphate isomerase/epimerase|nr:sugar phosphate isomerase/epimerase [Bacteroidales bacterium]